MDPMSQKSPGGNAKSVAFPAPGGLTAGPLIYEAIRELAIELSNVATSSVIARPSERVNIDMLLVDQSRFEELVWRHPTLFYVDVVYREHVDLAGNRFLEPVVQDGWTYLEACAYGCVAECDGALENVEFTAYPDSGLALTTINVVWALYGGGLPTAGPLSALSPAEVSFAIASLTSEGSIPSVGEFDSKGLASHLLSTVLVRGIGGKGCLLPLWFALITGSDIGNPVGTNTRSFDSECLRVLIADSPVFVWVPHSDAATVLAVSQYGMALVVRGNGIEVPRAMLVSGNVGQEARNTVVPFDALARFCSDNVACIELNDREPGTRAAAVPGTTVAVGYTDFGISGCPVFTGFVRREMLDGEPPKNLGFSASFTTPKETPLGVHTPITRASAWLYLADAASLVYAIALLYLSCSEIAVNRTLTPNVVTWLIEVGVELTTRIWVSMLCKPKAVSVEPHSRISSWTSPLAWVSSHRPTPGNAALMWRAPLLMEALSGVASYASLVSDALRDPRPTTFVLLPVACTLVLAWRGLADIVTDLRQGPLRGKLSDLGSSYSVLYAIGLVIQAGYSVEAAVKADTQSVFVASAIATVCVVGGLVEAWAYYSLLNRVLRGVENLNGEVGNIDGTAWEKLFNTCEAVGALAMFPVVNERDLPPIVSLSGHGARCAFDLKPSYHVLGRDMAGAMIEWRESSTEGKGVLMLHSEAALQSKVLDVHITYGNTLGFVPCSYHDSGGCGRFNAKSAPMGLLPVLAPRARKEWHDSSITVREAAHDIRAMSQMFRSHFTRDEVGRVVVELLSMRESRRLDSGLAPLPDDVIRVYRDGGRYAIVRASHDGLTRRKTRGVISSVLRHASDAMVEVCRMAPARRSEAQWPALMPGLSGSAERARMNSAGQSTSLREWYDQETEDVEHNFDGMLLWRLMNAGLNVRGVASQPYSAPLYQTNILTRITD